MSSINDIEDNVLFCSSCLSLRIMDAEGEDFCDICGNASIKNDTIEKWDELYRTKYGKSYIVKKKNNYKF